MKKFNVNKLLTFTLVLIVVACMATKVFAANVTIIGGNSENTERTNTTNQTTNNTTTILPTTNTSNVSSYSTSNTTTSTLPKTGESDMYVVGALIVVCGVAAIYTYKKIRDYKNM